MTIPSSRAGRTVLTVGALVLLSAGMGLAGPQGVRSVFLNGIDISGARNQVLKNVDLQITDNGDVYIIAPHYQVNEEDTYIPLSKFVQGLNAPRHQPRNALNSGNQGAQAGQGGQAGSAGSAQANPDTPAHGSSGSMPAAGGDTGTGTDAPAEKPEDAPPPSLPPHPEAGSATGGG